MPMSEGKGLVCRPFVSNLRLCPKDWMMGDDPPISSSFFLVLEVWMNDDDKSASFLSQSSMEKVAF